jgi:O-antigen ligase
MPATKVDALRPTTNFTVAGTSTTRRLERDVWVPVWMMIVWVIRILLQFDRSTNDLTAATQVVDAGDLYTQLTVVAFCLPGLAAFPRLLRENALRRTAVYRLLVVYSLWGLVTLIWSESPAVGLRRWLAFVLLTVAAAGFASLYASTPEGPARLLKLTMWLGILAAAVAVPVMAWQMVSGSGFRGGMNVLRQDGGNLLSFSAALALPAATYLYVRNPVRLFLAVLPHITLLVVVDSRSTLGFAVAVGAIVYFTSRFARYRRTALVAILAGIAAVLWFATQRTSLSAIMSSENPLVQHLLRNNPEAYVLDLSGRVTLWNALYPYVAISPNTGYGFGTFWTSSRMLDIWAAARWPAVLAHNGFIDEALATGIPGLLLLGGSWVIIVWNWPRLQSARAESESQALRWVCVLFLLLNLFDSIFQMYSRNPPAYLLPIAGYFLIVGRADREKKAARKVMQISRPRLPVTARS